MVIEQYNKLITECARDESDQEDDAKFVHGELKARTAAIMDLVMGLFILALKSSIISLVISLSACLQFSYFKNVSIHINKLHTVEYEYVIVTRLNQPGLLCRRMAKVH